ncbi:MAG: hypothetical protein ACRC10_00975 [Thermoguttaceae bacterium]
MSNKDLQTLPITWTVEVTTRENNELWCEVKFQNITDSQWLQVRQTALTYSNIHLMECPPLTISFLNRSFQFHLGRADEARSRLMEAGQVSAEEGERLRLRLIECAEVFRRYNLRFGFFDRRLFWKKGDAWQFIPAFWLSACEHIKSTLMGLPPELGGPNHSAPSASSDMYAIASLCFRAITGKEYNPAQPQKPSEVDSDLSAWDSVLVPALQTEPGERPSTIMAWGKIAAMGEESWQLVESGDSLTYADGSTWRSTRRSPLLNQLQEQPWMKDHFWPKIVIGFFLALCVLWMGTKIRLVP